MDTRSKIVAASEIPREGYAVVAGYFDPLLASHARRLTEIRGEHIGVAVVITSPANPLLAARDRAELVAALACVDYVVIEDLPDGLVHHEEHADEARYVELAAHIHRRHRTT